MIKTLRTLSKFILEADSNNIKKHPYIAIINFTNFLELVPEIWMFIPCNLEGKILEEPVDLGIFAPGQPFHSDYLKDKAAYDEAKSRCLFDGFYIKYPFDHRIETLNGTSLLTSDDDNDILEDFIATLKDWESEWVFNYEKLGDLVEAPLKLSNAGQKYIYGNNTNR